MCVRVIVTMKQAAVACRKYTYTYRKDIQATKEVGAGKKERGMKTVLARFVNLPSSTFKGTIVRFYFIFFSLFFHRASFARFTKTAGGLIKGYLKVAATIREKVFPLESRNKASRRR